MARLGFCQVFFTPFSPLIRPIIDSLLPTSFSSSRIVSLFLAPALRNRISFRLSFFVRTFHPETQPYSVPSQNTTSSASKIFYRFEKLPPLLLPERSAFLCQNSCMREAPPLLRRSLVPLPLFPISEWMTLAMSMVLSRYSRRLLCLFPRFRKTEDL